MPQNPAYREMERQFDVVLPDTLGHPVLGFRDGVWFRISAGGAPVGIPIRSALLQCPHAAGSIVQIACWWMREHHHAPRALDIATELALAVSELVRGGNQLDASTGASVLPMLQERSHAAPPPADPGSSQSFLSGMPGSSHVDGFGRRQQVPPQPAPTAATTMMPAVPPQAQWGDSGSRFSVPETPGFDTGQMGQHPLDELSRGDFRGRHDALSSSSSWDTYDAPGRHEYDGYGERRRGHAPPPRGNGQGRPPAHRPPPPRDW